jgi:hypothetical protein
MKKSPMQEKSDYHPIAQQCYEEEKEKIKIYNGEIS